MRSHLILTIQYVLLLTACYIPGLSFSQVSDSGKVEFKKQDKAGKPDYSTACRILENQLKQYPNNAELHYFLGYAIDRINAFDGSTLVAVKKERTQEASLHFETVNRLEPKYKGEIVVLDPYAKLSSIWGSLAQAYLFRQLPDSASWAFKEGKRRGGFDEPTLAYNRQLLNSCSPNAILVTNGDNITIPSWYLQQVENYRADVTVVDANLVNTSWYPKYLKHDKKLNISFTDTEIDSIDYIQFTPRYITVSNPNNTEEKFTWMLKPTYMEHYLLKGDRIMLNIVKENLFIRDIYFNIGSDSTLNLFLDDYFMQDGLVDKVLKKGHEIESAADSISPNLRRYSIAGINPAEIARSKDAIQLLNNFRWTYYSTIARLLNKNQKDRARAVFAEMEAKFPEDKLPYPAASYKAYFKRISDELK